MRGPTYSTIKSAYKPGDKIWVLNEDSVFTPVKIKEIKKKAFHTEIGDILYEDHGWLWRCFKPKEAT